MTQTSEADSIELKKFWSSENVNPVPVFDEYDPDGDVIECVMRQMNFSTVV